MFFFILGCSPNRLENVSYTIKYPKNLIVGETFDLVITIENADDEDHQFKWIEMGFPLEENTLFVSANPMFTGLYNYTPKKQMIFEYNLNIPSHSKKELVMQLMVITSGKITSELNLCFNEGEQCFRDEFQLLVNDNI